MVQVLSSLTGRWGPEGWGGGGEGSSLVYLYMKSRMDWASLCNVFIGCQSKKVTFYLIVVQSIKLLYFTTSPEC